MRFYGKVTAVVAALLLSGVGVYAQVQSVEDVEPPPRQFQDHGGVTPWFWVGIQTVFSAGYNMETGAGGFRNYGGDNYTWATFNLAFVDSHYQTPKFYEVPKEIDPEAWTGHFTLINFTSRLNSWTGSTEIENNAPAWLAEITGKGARVGFFTQAGYLIGGLDDPARAGEGGIKENKPIVRISGGNKVLNLGSGQLGKLYYEKSIDPNTSTTYNTTTGAIMYAGYEKKELWNVYLTMLSEGNVNTNITKDANGNDIGKGFAGVIDFGITPFGPYADETAPLTFDISGNAIAGFNFNGSSANASQNVGFGLKAESGIWLQDNLVVSPVLAFDGKINTNNDFFWKFGGGVIFRFSGMSFINTAADWGDLYAGGSSYNQTGNAGVDAFADHRYENNQVLKYAYAQVYGAYSEQSDLNILFRAEEPDGKLGFHDKLGAMFEMRLYNLTENTKTTAGVTNGMNWEAQGRVSWDLNIKQYLVTPYLRAYLNKDSVFKLRLGAYANIIPFTGFELCYTSANLNPNADTTAKPMSHYGSIFDAGRIEVLVILKSDDLRPQVPKRMSDWNYPTYVQHY